MLTELDTLGLETEGLRLWQALRRVGEWHADPPDGAAPAPDGRPRAFDDVDPGLRTGLAALDRLLRDPAPDDATLEAVAVACFHAATWAEERGAYRTALGFLHAAEDVYPENPHYAYNVGRVARKLALYEDAEAWLKWAHFVARTHRRWDVATLALSGLGNLHRQRGNLPRARRLHEAARRMARLKHLRTLEGDALYDLCVISLSAGDETKALDFARQAMAAYGPGHSQIHKLANDVAWFWMDSFGKFSSALHVFTVLLDYIWEPPFRVLLFANLARAAAGARSIGPFEAMWAECWAAFRTQASRQGHAAALVQLALGAGTLGYWERSAIAAREALQVARERREPEAVLVAEGILKAVEGGILVDDQLEPAFKDRFRTGHQQLDEAAADIAAQFANAMRARRDSAPESPTRALIHQNA
ncbi:MAG TPA: hypothetical protein VHG51_10080 [Longimicrobiaceae bacterium]|nr:hypothetical protein [Longimicrobiaceae bacterium]